MKIRYYTETDSLYIELLSNPGADVTIVNDDIRVDIDGNGNGRAVGVDIDNASKYYDVMHLETTSIPALRLAVAQPAAL